MDPVLFGIVVSSIILGMIFGWGLSRNKIIESRDDAFYTRKRLEEVTKDLRDALRKLEHEE